MCASKIQWRKWKQCHMQLKCKYKIVALWPWVWTSKSKCHTVFARASQTQFSPPNLCIYRRNPSIRKKYVYEVGKQSCICVRVCIIFKFNFIFFPSLFLSSEIHIFPFPLFNKCLNVCRFHLLHVCTCHGNIWCCVLFLCFLQQFYFLFVPLRLLFIIQNI